MHCASLAKHVMFVKQVMVHDPVTFPMVASKATVIDTGSNDPLGSHKTFAIQSFHMCYEINMCHFVLVIALNLPKPKYQLRQGGVHGSNSNLYGVDAADSADGGDKLTLLQVEMFFDG